ncbi:uncharacterized protein LOC102231809 [Xiphophorus maculatus]|uniref:uncharacterized protein LOC102231809 n=1 Tax=Xiphophorus maculatus TaxID=8083 RepID=UPI000C6E500E|nr:uncharacterized protein LOC102231809 [Xiphophorus maculatus]
MAVANPCLQKESMEWKREVEESRRKQWRGTICHQAMGEVRVEDEAEEEGKDVSSFKKVNEEEESREVGGPEKEKEEKSGHWKRKEDKEIAEANTKDDTGTTHFRTAGSAWVRCKRREPLSLWLYWMDDYMLLVDTVNLTIWILLNVTAPLQTPGDLPAPWIYLWVDM